MKAKNLILLGIVVALAAIPFFLGKDAFFEGADEMATKAVSGINPNYIPWATSIWKTPGKEMESLLFSLQAAIGAGIIGYGIAFLRGRKKTGG